MLYRVSQKWRTNGALRCRRDYRKRQKNLKKNSIGLVFWFGGLWMWHLTGQLFWNICMKLSWELRLIVYIITKYKITRYQYLILHNREFRSFGNRKNYFKSSTVTLQCNDVLIYHCLHCIILNNNNKNNWFFCLIHFLHIFFMYI
jgi:hypothetical protein